MNIQARKQSYNVSHPSVCEVHSMLVDEGYIGFKEPEGFCAIEASQEEQQDIIRVCAELVCIAFERSFQRANVEWSSSIIAACYAFSDAEQQMLKAPLNAAQEWDDRNQTIHFAPIGNCGSPKSLDLFGTQYDLSRRYRLKAHGSDRSLKSRSPWVEKSAQEHELLKQAVLGNNIAEGQKIL